MESSDYITTYIRFGLLKLRIGRVSLLLIALVVALPCNILLSQPTVAQEIGQSPTLSKNTIYVNPQAGDDSQAGKKSSPLKTITQAVEIAPDGSTIQLASGYV